MAYQEKVKSKVKYRDLDFSFFRNPVTKDVSVKINEEAIKSSVRNLILTNKYERLFQPSINSGVRSKLFENINPQVAYTLKDDIETTLNTYEPRIKLINVSIGQLVQDENTIVISLQYQLLDESNLITQNITVERIR